MHRAARPLLPALPWQNKQIIDSIHVPEIVIVNNAASGNG
jgi:hypothetical protein